MERAIVAARALYHVTGDTELKVILDRAELCWYKWHDASDYSALIEKCSEVTSGLF